VKKQYGLPGWHKRGEVQLLAEMGNYVTRCPISFSSFGQANLA
jgi:hypothetical protein